MRLRKNYPDLWKILFLQSTHPLRGATVYKLVSGKLSLNLQSTHPLRGATRRFQKSRVQHRLQSTHPLRGATHEIEKLLAPFLLQSTHPLRGATVALALIGALLKTFNPRTPCGVRLLHRKHKDNLKTFNPRTPCGVRRSKKVLSFTGLILQSTHPLRGATATDFFYEQLKTAFNPRTPCGVRHAHK